MKSRSVLLSADQTLAELLYAKFLGRLHGLISVGVGVASFDFETWKSFFSGRTSLISAFIEVFASLAVEYPKQGIRKTLVQHVERMALCWDQFCRQVTTLAEWKTMAPTEIETAGEQLLSTYSGMARAIQYFAEFIGVAPDEKGLWRRTSEMLRLFLKDIAERKGSSSAP
jgi:hypothetical protein